MKSDNDEHDEFTLRVAIGTRRLEWGYTHLARAEEDRRWASLELEESVDMVTNNAGANLYALVVTRRLKAAQHLLLVNMEPSRSKCSFVPV